MSNETQKSRGQEVATMQIQSHGLSVFWLDRRGQCDPTIIRICGNREESENQAAWMGRELASLIDAERADAVKGFPLGDLSELHESQEIANRAVRSDITYLSERIDRIESPDTFRRDLAAKIYLRHMGCEGVGSFRSCAERSIRGADALIAALKGEVKP